MPSMQEEALESCRELQRRLRKAELGSDDWLSVMDALANLHIALLIRNAEERINAKPC